MSRACRSISAVFLVSIFAGSAWGGELRMQPSLTVSEEYTDNVHDSSTDQESDYITRAIPGFALTYKAPVLDSSLSYYYDYRYYARKTRDDDSTHQLAARGRFTAIDNLLFIDISDEFRRVSLDVTREFADESLFVNQEDRNIASISPYFIISPTQRSSLKGGYRFVDTRYFDSPAVDKTDHSFFIESRYEFSSQWSISAGYIFTAEQSELDDLTQHQAYAGFRYEYADRSYLFAQGGNTWIDYQEGRNMSNLYWNLGFSHLFEVATSTLSAGVRYSEDPLRNITEETFVTWNIDRPFQSGSTGISLYFSEYSLPESDGFLTRKYGGAIRGRYELTPKMNGNLSFTGEQFDEVDVDQQEGATRRFIVNTGLSYLLYNNITVSAIYIFVDNYSREFAENNRQVNRAVLEARLIF